MSVELWCKTEHLVPRLLVVTESWAYTQVPEEPTFAHSLGACGFSFFHPMCSVETESGVSVRGEGRKYFFPLDLLKIAASSVSKNRPGSGLLPSAELLGSGSPLWSLHLHLFSFHTGPSSSFCAFPLVIALLRKGIVKKLTP